MSGRILHRECVPAFLAGVFPLGRVHEANEWLSAVARQGARHAYYAIVRLAVVWFGLAEDKVKERLHSVTCAFVALTVNLLLVSCTTDPNAGMVAARLTGQPEYLAFSRNGKADSAAVFPFAGKRYIYHPSFGSAALPPGDYPATACIPHSFLAQVQFEPRDAFLPHGCLVRAIAEVRTKGGRVAMANGDARRVP